MARRATPQLVVLAVMGLSPLLLASCRGSRARTPLDNLTHPEAAVRSFALEYLEPQWVPEARPIVRRLVLADPVPGVRQVAADTLARYPDPALQVFLIDALGFERDPGTRANLARLLAENPSEPAARRLEQAASQHDLVLVAGGVQFFLTREGTPDDLVVAAYRCCGSQRMLQTVQRLANPKLRTTILAIDAELRGVVTTQAAGTVRRGRHAGK